MLLLGWVPHSAAVATGPSPNDGRVGISCGWPSFHTEGPTCTHPRLGGGACGSRLRVRHSFILYIHISYLVPCTLCVALGLRVALECEAELPPRLHERGELGLADDHRRGPDRVDLV